MGPLLYPRKEKDGSKTSMDTIHCNCWEKGTQTRRDMAHTQHRAQRRYTAISDKIGHGQDRTHTDLRKYNYSRKKKVQMM